MAMPSPEELRQKYAVFLDNEDIMNMASWHETNTDAPFDAEAMLAFGKAHSEDFVRITDTILEQICQQNPMKQ